MGCSKGSRRLNGQAGGLLDPGFNRAAWDRDLLAAGAAEESALRGLDTLDVTTADVRRSADQLARVEGQIGGAIEAANLMAHHAPVRHDGAQFRGRSANHGGGADEQAKRAAR